MKRSTADSEGLAQDRRADLRRREIDLVQTLSSQPDRPDLLAQLAAILHETGRPAEAIAALTRASLLDPGCADFAYSLGMLNAEKRSFHEARGHFERALALDPRHAAAALHLGDALMDLREHALALSVYRHAITLRTPFPEAHANLAGALLHVGDARSAAAECRRALAERPGAVTALNTLGSALSQLGRLDEAIEALQAAVMLKPDYVNAHHNLGNVLDKAGRVEAAKEAYRTALALDPGLEEAQYSLAALGGAPPPAQTPTAYLLRLFDSYAPTFDRHLVEELGYAVPERLYESVQAAMPGASGLDVIDLGCGTGLVGRRFRGVARRLCGIDLSPGMIACARGAALYDDLRIGDCLESLIARREPCDLVLAADVFIYAGDLEPIFREVARLLRPGGLFAFSLETISEGDYVLQRNRRYAHSRAYIGRLASANSLSEALVTPVQLRRQGEDHAEGTIVVLKSDGAAV